MNGNELKEARLTLGLTQLELACKLGYRGKNMKEQVQRMELDQRPVMPKKLVIIERLLKEHGYEN